MFRIRMQLLVGLGLTLTVTSGLAAAGGTDHPGAARGQAMLASNPAEEAASPGLDVGTATGFAREPGTGEPCPVALPFPRALPASVIGWTQQTCGGHLASWRLALTGAANTDNRGIPAVSAAQEHGPSGAAYLVSFAAPAGPVGWTVLPDPITDDDTVTITAITLADGSAARFTTPTRSVGMSRVEWIKAGSYFQVLCDHGVAASDGITGIPDADLLALANSVR